MNIKDANLLKMLYGVTGAANLTLGVLMLVTCAIYPEFAEGWMVVLCLVNFLFAAMFFAIIKWINQKGGGAGE